ncbi:hypothetical protein EVAR_11805_1 [Eumeta japonica]|uniref:Mariner Mos1 transposase n=1 Tax=Eumeta variegata TaxID=151549 RepID=A0A4C1UPE4_EUMVA|nr:hypothetical protein EVAR_11805_1 [Eumeta japonica]
MKDASERFFSIAINHPNQMISSAASYKPPPANFIRRPWNVLTDSPDDLISKSTSNGLTLGKLTVYRCHPEVPTRVETSSDSLFRGDPNGPPVDLLLQHELHKWPSEYNCDGYTDSTAIYRWRIRLLQILRDEFWIYEYDPETKQQSTMWVFQDEANPSKVIRAYLKHFEAYGDLFGINGHVITVPLGNQKTVNLEWHMTIFLSYVFEEIRKNSRQRRIILCHDYASCHTSTEKTQFLEGQKIELTGHPPYSHDLVPKDFYLFPSAKNKLRGQFFSRREKVVDAFKIHVLEIFQSECKSAIKICFNVCKNAFIIMTILND